MYITGFVRMNKLTLLFTREFSNKIHTKKVTLYFQRAKLIDSIRIALLSNDTTSIQKILNDPKIDSFTVANALKSAPSLEKALFLIEELKAVPQFRHTQCTIYALARVLAKFQDSRKLKALIDGINSGKFPYVPRVSFMEAVRLYSSAGDIDSVISIWEKWREKERGPSAETYNVLMCHYVRIGNNEEAMKVFNTMINEGLVANSRTYTVMIEHLVKLEKYDAALEIFAMLPMMKIKRTLRQYLILLGAVIGAENYKLATVLLNEMKVDGKLPCQAMLSPLQKMHEAGFVRETVEFIRALSPDKRIKRLSCPLEDDDDDDDNDKKDEDVVHLKPWLDPSALASALRYWEPDEVSVLEDFGLIWTSRLVCKMIRSFKSAETAFQFFSWVANKPGFAHEVHTISQMIYKLAQNGHVDLVDKILFKTKSENIRLSPTTVAMVIEYYGVNKKGQASLKIFREIGTFCDPISDKHKLLLYKSLLRTLSKCKMSSSILDIVDEMVLGDIFPDINTFIELMNHFAREEDIKAVQRLYSMVKQSDIKPDTYMYQVLIRIFCERDRAVFALRVFEDMLNLDLIPDIATKQMLVKNLWKGGKLREAASVEERSEEINKNGTLPVAPQGRFYTGDIARVCNIYCENFSTHVRIS